MILLAILAAQVITILLLIGLIVIVAVKK